jgi:hypothetical protein
MTTKGIAMKNKYIVWRETKVEHGTDCCSYGPFPTLLEAQKWIMCMFDENEHIQIAELRHPYALREKKETL